MFFVFCVFLQGKMERFLIKEKLTSLGQMPRKKEGQNKQQSYSASYLTSREKTPMSI